MSTSSPKLERRSGKTYSKHVKLTPIGREKIEQWAVAHSINFSAAIEMLALIGLEDPSVTYVISGLRAVTKQGLDEAFSQINQTLHHVQQEATLTRLLTEAVLLQWVRSEATTRPDDFESALGVSRTSKSEQAMRIRQFHDKLKTAAVTEALRQIASLIEDDRLAAASQGETSYDSR